MNPKSDNPFNADAFIAMHEYPIKRRSGWATYLRIGSWFFVICFVFILATFIRDYKQNTESKNDELSIYLIIAGCCIVQGFFAAFLLDVFTDIRWLLKINVEGQEKLVKVLGEMNRKE